MRLDKILFPLRTAGTVNVGQQRIGIAYQLIVIVPGIIAISTGRVVEVTSVDGVAPPGQIDREILTGIISIIHLDSTFPVETL